MKRGNRQICIIPVDIDLKKPPIFDYIIMITVVSSTKKIYLQVSVKWEEQPRRRKEREEK